MKRVSILLMVILLFNFIICNAAYAEPDNNTTNNTTGSQIVFNASSLYQADSKGTIEVEGHEKEIKATQSTIASIIGALSGLVTYIDTIISSAITTIAVYCGFNHTDSEYGIDKDLTLKVSSIIFDELILFDTDVLNTTETLNPSITPSPIARTLDDIKESVIAIYETIRAISMVAFGALFLYAIYKITYTDDANIFAKQKALAWDWAKAFAFSYISRYFIIGCNMLLDISMESIWSARLAMEQAGFSSFEFETHKNILVLLAQTGGLTYCGHAILRFVLFFITCKFFIKYLIRSFKIFLLVALCPLAGVQFSIESSHSEGASSNGNAILRWVGTYLTLLFIQPIHAIIYLIFVFSAAEIAIQAPLLGILFLMALDRAEKVIRAILGLDDRIKIKGGK